MKSLALLALFAMILPASTALAEEPVEVVYQKHTVVSFGDDTIDGTLSRPDERVTESRRRLTHAKLIKIRDNFRRQILTSVK
ncbi:MAG: hypothetical protein AAFQ82_11110 [Myxococcota bacterium]